LVGADIWTTSVRSVRFAWQAAQVVADSFQFLIRRWRNVTSRGVAITTIRIHIHIRRSARIRPCVEHWRQLKAAVRMRFDFLIGTRGIGRRFHARLDLGRCGRIWSRSILRCDALLTKFAHRFGPLLQRLALLIFQLHELRLKIRELRDLGNRLSDDPLGTRHIGNQIATPMHASLRLGIGSWRTRRFITLHMLMPVARPTREVSSLATVVRRVIREHRVIAPSLRSPRI
jgi:hypothetical protein